MIGSRWVPLVLIVSSFSVVARCENAIPGDQFIDTLSYIRKGYESNQTNTEPVIIEGRVFHSQKAREGYTLPSNKVFEPRWYPFRILSKEGKRRYEQETLTTNAADPTYAMYVLENNRRILNYAPYAVKIFPIANEDALWNEMAGLHGKMMRPSLVQGYETVALMTQTLAKYIEDEVFEDEKSDMSMTVDSEGVFHILVKRGIVEEEYWIDSRRGFNLVRAKHSHPHEKLWYETEQTLEYTQLEDGRWVLEKATRHDVENDAVIEHRLETTAIRTDAEIPDDVFELESLNLPPDVYTLDYSFSPPLELNRGNLPDVDYLQDLMDTPVESNQIASVAADGHVTIGDHAAFIQHEKNRPSEHLAQDGSVQMQVLPRARRALPWIVGLVLAISVSFGAFSWRCRVRRARQ